MKIISSFSGVHSHDVGVKGEQCIAFMVDDETLLVPPAKIVDFKKRLIDLFDSLGAEVKNE